MSQIVAARPRAATTTAKPITTTSLLYMSTGMLGFPFADNRPINAMPPPTTARTPTTIDIPNQIFVNVPHFLFSMN